jgi:hypothetical protein
MFSSSAHFGWRRGEVAIGMSPDGRSLPFSFLDQNEKNFISRYSHKRSQLVTRMRELEKAIYAIEKSIATLELRLSSFAFATDPAQLSFFNDLLEQMKGLTLAKSTLLETAIVPVQQVIQKISEKIADIQSHTVILQPEPKQAYIQLVFDRLTSSVEIQLDSEVNNYDALLDMLNQFIKLKENNISDIKIYEKDSSKPRLSMKIFASICNLLIENITHIITPRNNLTLHR